MDRKLLTDCPVCGGSLRVRELRCVACGTRIRGSFEPPHGKLLSLSGRDLEFVELFVRARGNIKELEKTLKVSYPTVRSMLDGVIERLGYAPKRKSPPDAAARMVIIDRLERGEIDADKASRLLSGAEDDELGEESKTGQEAPEGGAGGDA